MLRISSFAAGVFVADVCASPPRTPGPRTSSSTASNAPPPLRSRPSISEKRCQSTSPRSTYPAKNFTERTLAGLEENVLGPGPAAGKQVGGRGLPGFGHIQGAVAAQLARPGNRVGGVHVRNQRARPREYILTGPAQVTLCDDDLTPANVSALSVGDSRRDMVEQVATGGVLIDPQSQTSRNVRMAGLITLGRPTVDDNFDGNFAYSLEGYTHFVSRTRVAVSGEVYQTYESRTSAQNAWVSGILEHGDLGWQEDMRFSTGTLTSFTKRGAVLDQPETLDSHSIRTSGLRIRNSGDYMVDAEYFLIGGSVNYTIPADAHGRRDTSSSRSVNYTFPQNRGMDCSNGGYTFKTNVPVRKPSGFQPTSYDAGEILINGAALVKFSANADPSELGEMHIDLDVANVGSFDYDGNGFYETALPAAARCVN